MSKYVKNLVVNDLKKRLEGVGDALVVDVIGLNSANTYALRKQLRQKNISLLVVNNSLARRATEGTSLANAFQGLDGSLALFWGGEDFISLVKEFVAIDKSGKFEKLKARGGVMEGEKITPERVKDIAKWPNRQQQLGILLGQILSPGAKLLSQLNAPGGLLLSQIEKKAKDESGAGQDGGAEGGAAGEATGGATGGAAGEAKSGEAKSGEAKSAEASAGSATDSPPA